MNASLRRPHGRAALLAVLAVFAVLTIGSLPAGAAEGPQSDEAESLVEVTVESRAEIDELIANDVDLAEYVRENSDGTLTVNAFVTPSERSLIAQLGGRLGATIESPATYAARLAERAEALAAERRAKHAAQTGRSTFSADSETDQALANADKVTTMRADYFTNYAGQFLSVEAHTSTGSGTTLSMSYDQGSGYGTATTMTAFVDSGQYMYHRLLVRIPNGTPAPTRARIGSSGGGIAEKDVSTWVGGGLPPLADGFLSGFFTSYMDPTQVYGRMNSLAQEFPNIVEMVDLPNLTTGYQRKSMAVMAGDGTAINGSPSDASQAVLLTAKAYGQDGGNQVQAEFVVGAPPPTSPTVVVAGKKVTVQLGIGSTAAQVVQAVNTSPAASALVTASTYAGNAGGGVVQPRTLVTLSDFLNAPASVKRGPFQVQAIRIGKQRDGSKVGVFLYCQQHAREWVTPLVCLETAERLVRNYAIDPLTKRIVDTLDVFIVPSVNPDGSHYSLYDFASQRKNLTNYCGATSSGMPSSRNSWGVDVNRNNTVGSRLDGYSGASSSCTSETYSGPSEASEPEIKNEQWVVETFQNIKFSNNIHSYGGYFMWAPGSYVAAGRITLPAPNIGIEHYFFRGADLILNRIKEYRNTTILPARTGPVADVLYSAAGNSADEQWYRRGIIAYSFEVGADRFSSTETGTTQSIVGFQPNFESEGRHEGMEFASGNYGLLETALEYSADTTAPVVVAQPNGAFSKEPIEVTFKWVNEPSVIHFTTDGSTPTEASPVWQAQGPRRPGEILVFGETTTLKWIAKDIRGNTAPVASATFYIDTVAPLTSASLNPPAQNGWSRATTVTLAGNDGANGSGIASIQYQLDGGGWQTYSAPFPLANEGEHLLEFRATDRAGNEEEAKSQTIKVDATDPTVTIASPAQGQTFGVGKAATATYSCADGLSGIASCTGQVPSGGVLDTSEVGTRTFEVTATDIAGNVRKTIHTYNVVWKAFDGFFQPVDNPPTLNVVPAGNGVPVVFTLGGDYGLGVVAAGYPQAPQVPCPSGPTDQIERVFGSGQSSIVYDAKTRLYTYNWKTMPKWKNTCRKFTLKLADNSLHKALFRFT